MSKQLISSFKNSHKEFLKSFSEQNKNRIKEVEESPYPNHLMENLLWDAFYQILNDDSIENKFDTYAKFEEEISYEVARENLLINRESALAIQKDSDENCLKFNDNFANKLSKLNSNEYIKVVKDFANNHTNSYEINSLEDLESKINQYKMINNARKQRGLLRKIGDFFTGRSRKEKRELQIAKNNIKQSFSKLGYANNNAEEIFNTDRHVSANELTQYFNLEQRPFASSIFELYDTKFDYNIAKNKENVAKNVELFTRAFEAFNEMKTDRLGYDVFKQELKDCSKVLGIEDKFERLLQCKSKEEIKKVVDKGMTLESKQIVINEFAEEANEAIRLEAINRSKQLENQNEINTDKKEEEISTNIDF